MRPADQTPLPATLGEAALRAARGRCPRCGEGRLFRAWLKPVAQCPACAIDWSPQRADDFPAYIVIILTGHLMAPIIIALIRSEVLGLPALFAISVPSALAFMLVLLQPVKGLVIAVQWWLGLNEFRKERPSSGAPSHDQDVP